MIAVRTGYSFKLAVGHVKSVVDRLVELGKTDAPIADRGGTFGFVSWTKACATANLRPVYGVELAVSDNWGTKSRKEASPEQQPRFDYWTFLAKSDLSDLHQLVRAATGKAAKVPVLSYDEALGAPGVIKVANEQVDIDLVDFDIEDVYMGLTPATPLGLVRAAARRGALFVAGSRNVYPCSGDLEFYRVMLGRHSASTQTYPQHILSDDELAAALAPAALATDIAKAMDHSREIVSGCCAVLEKGELLHFNAEKTLHQLCEEGAARLGVDLSVPMYRERIDRELALIAEKKFDDYFHIISDLVNWAKPRMVVGPARGSSCGSLACYLLGITAIDPIPHGLIFERFIDITRADLPDIDLDFSRQDEVMAYAEQRYGERVARLASVSIFQSRSALARVGAALKIPSWQVEKVAETAFKRMMGDSRKSSTILDTLTDTDPGRVMLKEFPQAVIAGRFEGHPDHSSIHAAGLVVTDKPVSTYVAVDRRNGTAMCNKYDAEYLNLLKIDVLGLTQLSIFERTLELIGESPVSGWLEKIPLDDAKAFDLLNRHKYCGVFQFTGAAMRGLAKQITFESFEDIVAATALVRPGPLASGGTSQWVERRAGRQAVTYPHPLLEEFLRDTYGIPVYQEQILRIGRELGDLSWADVTQLRKAMSRSLGKEYFDQYGDKWKETAIKKGMPPEVATEFWVAMCLDANTKIRLAKRSKPLTIKQLYRKYESHQTYEIKRKGSRPSLVSLFPDGRGHTQKALKFIKSGRKVCWKYMFEDKSHVICTPDHRFIVNGGWQKIGEAKIGDDFAFMGEDYEKRGSRARNHTGGGKGSGKRDTLGRYSGTGRVSFAKDFRREMTGKPCADCGKIATHMEVHHNDFVEGRKRLRDVAWLCPSCHRTRHWQFGRGATPPWGVGKAVTSKRLVKRQKIGLREVYDISMEKHFNFTLQNGLITHNCQYGAWCLSGDTVLVDPYGNQSHKKRTFTLRELYENGGSFNSQTGKKQNLLCLQDGRIKPLRLVDVYYRGRQKTWLVKVESGESIRATKAHRFLGVDGKYWRLDDLRPGDAVISIGWSAGRTAVASKIVSISDPKIEDTYDVAMPEPYNNFVANNFVVHNSFNKSHSVAYAYVSYWCAYLKAHYPTEFAAATLDAEEKPERQIELLRELAEEGIGYIPVDPERSTARWQATSDGRLLGPLTNIKSIGPAKMLLILQARRGERKLTASQAKLLENPKTAIDSLFPIRDRVRTLYPNGLGDANIASLPTPVIACQPGIQGPQVIVVVINRLIPKDENEPVKVARRGGVLLDGPIQALNMFVRDDGDEMFAKIGRFKFNELGKPVQEEGKPGKVIYALKGVVPPSFRMLDVRQVRKLGYMEEGYDDNRPSGDPD
jgi:hypothetical protein